MDDEAIHQAYFSLYDDIRDEPFGNMPLLAHYTSTAVLENILKNDEIWLSNPLFMNDHEEIRFGVLEGHARVSSSMEIKTAFREIELYNKFSNSFLSLFNQFAQFDVLDYFIFCLGRHDNSDYDGKLSMWRGYGADASGACIVFSPTKITSIDDSPLVLSKVIYASPDERIDWINQLIKKFCSLVSALPPTESAAQIAATSLFERLKLFALFTKHTGFLEEEEWRLAYIPSRDVQSRYRDMISYWLGPRGLEPKLKLKLRNIPELPPNSISLEDIVERIVLGPTASNPLAKTMILRMLEILGKRGLHSKVHSSTIPYRPSK